jgi:hypothetical protein
VRRSLTNSRVTSEDEVKSWIKHFGVTREELAVELAVQ